MSKTKNQPIDVVRELMKRDSKLSSDQYYEMYRSLGGKKIGKQKFFRTVDEIRVKEAAKRQRIAQAQRRRWAKAKAKAKTTFSVEQLQEATKYFAIFGFDKQHAVRYLRVAGNR